MILHLFEICIISLSTQSGGRSPLTETSRSISFFPKATLWKPPQRWKSSMWWKLARTSTMNMTWARTVETTQTGTLPAILTARNILCERCVKTMVSLQYGFIKTSRMWRKTQSTVQVLKMIKWFHTSPLSNIKAYMFVFHLDVSIINHFQRIIIFLPLQTQKGHVAPYSMEMKSFTTALSLAELFMSTQSSSQALNLDFRTRIWPWSR